MRNRAFRRHQRSRVISRKKKIARHKNWNFTHAGIFNKGKVHCSCWMCSDKGRIVWLKGHNHSYKEQLKELSKLEVWVEETSYPSSVDRTRREGC